MNLLDMVDPTGVVQPTRLTHKLTVDGRSEPYPVYRIRLDQLRYNRQNDRIATWVSQYRSEHDGGLPSEEDRELFNKVVETMVIKSNEDAIRKTSNNIRLFDQRVPAVVLSNGLIVDGNRRFTCLRRLSRDEPRFGWLEAVILPASVGDDPKRIKLLELAIQHGEEGKVGYDPIDRLAGVYIDIIHDRLLTVEEYAMAAGTTVREVRSMVEMAGYAAEFLEFLDCAGQFHLIRELDVFGALSELPALMRRCANEDEEETVRQVFYANLAIEPSRDARMVARRFRRILESPGARDFVEEEVELAAGVVDALAQVTSVTPAFVREELRGNQELVDSFMDALARADAKARGARMLSGPLDKLKRASHLLGRVDTEVLAHLESQDRRSVLQALDELTGRLEELRSALPRE